MLLDQPRPRSESKVCSFITREGLPLLEMPTPTFSLNPPSPHGAHFFSRGRPRRNACPLFAPMATPPALVPGGSSLPTLVSVMVKVSATAVMEAVVVAGESSTPAAAAAPRGLRD